MGHHNPTEKYSENATQIEQLQETLKLNKCDSYMTNKLTIKYKGSIRREQKKGLQESSDKTYFSQHIWKVRHKNHKSNLTICRVPESH